MTTLREADQQALEAMEGELPDWRTPAQAKAITALRDALAQPEQGPVVVVEQEPDYMSRGHFYEGSKPFIDPTEVWKLPIGTKLYTAQPRHDIEKAAVAAQREKLAHWMRSLGYATGHGDSIEDLLDHLGTQISEGLEAEVLMEREACAKVCEGPGWNAANWCAAAIRARGKT